MHSHAPFLILVQSQILENVHEFAHEHLKAKSDYMKERYDILTNSQTLNVNWTYNLFHAKHQRLAHM